MASEWSSLIWIDQRLVLRVDFFAIPPLPGVVAVVVDFLDRGGRFCRDIVWGSSGRSSTSSWTVDSLGWLSRSLCSASASAYVSTSRSRSGID